MAIVSRNSVTVLFATLLLAAVPGSADIGTGPGAVAGRVVGGSSPLGAAAVYAYHVVDLSLKKVTTDLEGNFRFADLPPGVYNFIAHRPGFVPAVVRLTRTTAAAYQFLEIQLARQTAGAGGAGNDFWKLRSKIPADVLREIEANSAQEAAASGLVVPPDVSGFQTELQGISGISENRAGELAQLKGGQVGVEGRLGRMQVGLTGKVLQLAGEDQATARSYTDGEVRSLSLDLENGPSSRISVSSLSNRLESVSHTADDAVDFEHYRVSWSQDHGDHGRSDFTAQYTNESNYHRQDLFDPPDIPEASRAWLVEGSYTAAIGDRGTLQAGLRYRERQSELPGFGFLRDPTRLDQTDRSNVDVFGRGGVRLQPALLVEYGMFSTLRDGSVAFTPKGGVVLQLGQDWQAESSFSRRVYQNATDDRTDFVPALFRSSDFCEQGGESCYSVSIARKKGDDNRISVGAMQRKITETSRLYFSEDLLDRSESLYLVRGDNLPEIQFLAQHRISPNVVTKLESSLASGGGGIFFATDRHHYENKLSYFVTSLDTQFKSTETGVFIAFHKLSQELDPVTPNRGVPAEMEMEKLRLVVSQNLNLLLDLGTDWTLRFDVEVSRGEDIVHRAGDDTPSDDLRKRFVGGFAVRF
ncbi:MAG TPA: carboxypeptidase-like regulatory domain-containing protein [Thermoanaerobaculia bacterium]|nr:carboxypeptidase-like regulatory domain-containing protein [Thermoanaerobaculia bacterium]